MAGRSDEERFDDGSAAEGAASKVDESEAAPRIELRESPGYWRDAWNRFRLNRLGLLGLGVVLAFFLIALLAPALANEQPFRDLLVATAFISNSDFYPIADAYAEPYTNGDPTIADGAPGATVDEQKENFFAVFNELTRITNQALDDIDEVRFRLESVRARIDQTKQDHIRTQAVLQNTIDNVENVDIDEVAVKINAVQLQLEASYRVTSSVQQLSLVNFI